MYKKLEGDSDILLLCLYVDDVLYMGSSSKMLQEFKDIMFKTFEMSYLGPLSCFLGLEVKQSDGALFVTQQKYVDDLLKKADMMGCNSAISPINANEKLRLEDSSGKADPSRYRRLVSGLLFLTHSRPDLTYFIGVVSRFMQAPTMHHLGAVERILHYVSGTTGYGLHYTCNNNFKLVGFTDSDWSGSPDD